MRANFLTAFLTLILFLAAMENKMQAQTVNLSLEVDKVCTIVFDASIDFHNASLGEDVVLFKIIENKMMVAVQKVFTDLTINVELANKDFYSISCRQAYSNGTTFLDMRTMGNGSQRIGSKSLIEGDRNVEDNKVLSVQALERVNENVQNFLIGKKVGNDRYLDLNYRSGGVKAYLSNIYSDKDHIYFNINIKNSSGVIYEQDYTTVFYENRRGIGGGDYSNKQAYNVDVFPTFSSFEKDSEGGILRPGQTRVISMAVPIFAISNNSRFKLIAYEKNGFRNITFQLSGSKLNRILKRNRI